MSQEDELEPCPYCGEDGFGNAGARANHVRSCKEKAEKYNDTTEAEEPEVVEAEPAQQPAVKEQPTETAAAPATQAGGGALDIGAQAADIISSGVGGDPESKAEAQSKALEAGAGLLAQLAQTTRDSKIKGAERSRRTSQDKVETVEDYVRCPECDSQLTNLPPAGTEFSCPTCGEQLRISE